MFCMFPFGKICVFVLISASLNLSRSGRPSGKAARRRADGEEGDCMYRLTINGAVHEIAEDGSLLDYLRDTADITSVKNGCAEGVCGACTVLIDGRTARACIQKISRLDGKSVTTLEGLSERERDFGRSEPSRTSPCRGCRSRTAPPRPFRRHRRRPPSPGD